MKKIFLFALLFCLFMGQTRLQAASISGTVVDDATGEAIVNAQVTLFHEHCRDTTSICSIRQKHTEYYR